MKVWTRRIGSGTEEDPFTCGFATFQWRKEKVIPAGPKAGTWWLVEVPDTDIDVKQYRERYPKNQPKPEHLENEP